MIKQNKIIDNDQWISRHFEEIVNTYGGKVPYIFVSRGKIFPVRSPRNIAKLENKITRLHGKPVGMPVPAPKDFNSILWEC